MGHNCTFFNVLAYNVLKSVRFFTSFNKKYYLCLIIRLKGYDFY